MWALKEDEGCGAANEGKINPQFHSHFSRDCLKIQHQKLLTTYTTSVGAPLK